MVIAIPPTVEHPLTPHEKLASAVSDAAIRQIPPGDTVSIDWKNGALTRTDGNDRVTQASQTGLSSAEIALRIMGDGTYKPVRQLTNALTDPTPDSHPPDTSSPSVAEVVAMSPADRFYALSDPDSYTANMDDEEKASYLAAYNAHTLVIRDASELPELKIDDRTTMGYDSAGFSESGSLSWDSALAGKLYGPNAFLQVSTGFSPVMVSWGSKTDGSVLDTTA